MSAGDRPVRGEWLYRLLMRLYPREFRRRYAGDMLDFYRDRVAMARGVFAFLSVWLQLLPDLLASAFAERFAWVHRDLEPAPRVAREYSHRREATMSILFQDMGYALRGMLRRPMFTIVVLGTLALGIGANAAIFTVVNAVLLRPLPYAHPERLVDLSHGDDGGGWTVSEPEFIDYQRGVTGLERLAAYNGNSVTISVPNGEPMRAVATRVSRDFFDVLGVKPALGRVFAPDEFSHLSKARVVVIGHRLWVQQFAGDRNVIGKTLVIGTAKPTIIGVMPSEFTFPDNETQIWTAWRLNPDSLWTRNNHYLNLVGRMAPNATLGLVRSQVRTLNQRWVKDFPETYAPDQPITRQATPILDFLLGPTRPYLLALLGAVGFILLIACVNVANLLLVRGESRRKEFAIRAALGASGSRVVRQVLTESMMLALFGALLGAGVAVFGVRALVALAPADVPRLDQVNADYRVVLFTAAITVVTGLLFGIAPALRGVRGDSADTLREGGKTSGQSAPAVARRALVVAEVALAVVMLSGAGLLVRSLIKLQQIHLGFDPRQTLTMQITLPLLKYNDTTADAYYRQALERIRVLPGVKSAAGVGYLPISGSDNGWSIMLDGRVLKTIAEAPAAKPVQVTPDFFATMGTKLLHGRVFTAQDRMGAPPVAVVSEGMAKKLWPGVDPIGHTLKMFNDKAPWVTIVGVVEDVRSRGIQASIPETMYFPYSQSGATAYYQPYTVTLVVRAIGNPAALATPVRAVARSLDATVAISQVLTMEQVVGDSIASRRFATVLLAGFAALALALAGIGIYGVISYGVSQRTYEIGVRMAMGATPAAIMRLVMREGGRMTALGFLIGVVGSVLVDRLLVAMLVGVSATDALTFAVLTAVLGAVAACACLLPARRATAVSPTEALRNN